GRWRGGAGGRPAGMGRRAVWPSRGHPPHEHGKRRTRAGMRCEQRGHGERRIAEARNRARLEQYREHESTSAVGTDSAVAHDLELLFACRSSAEAIERVGETVLMQATGDEHGRRDSEQRRDEWTKIELEADPVDEPGQEADPGADDRKAPACPCHVGAFAGSTPRYGQAREER